MNREQVVQTQAFVMRESFKAQIEKLLAEDKTLKEKDLKFKMRRKVQIIFKTFKGMTCNLCLAEFAWVKVFRIIPALRILRLI